MKNSINTRFERISLHDSLMEGVTRNGDSLIVEFSWSYLSDYKEKAIEEGIITGKSIFASSSVVDEKILQLNDGGGMVEIDKPDDFGEYFELIATTDFRIESNTQILSIGGFYEKDHVYLFLQWDIYFKTGSYGWNTQVLHSEWKEGKLPEG